jgi:hypothetical protein
MGVGEEKPIGTSATSFVGNDGHGLDRIKNKLFNSLR